MSEPLTLKDWETLYNMLKQSEQFVQEQQEEIRQLAIRTAKLEAFKDKELHEQITQLEMRFRQSEARIPKTGLLSRNMLTRIVTVCGYVFFASIISSLVVWLFAILRLLSFPIQIGGSSWQTTSLPSIIILFLVIMITVILVRKSRQTENDVEFIN
jgi:preprotein translocase subunit SecG